MTAKNDITGDSIVSKINSDKYRDAFDVIFGIDKCKVCGKVSPLDGDYYVHTCKPKEINDR